MQKQTKANKSTISLTTGKVTNTTLPTKANKVKPASKPASKPAAAPVAVLTAGAAPTAASQLFATVNKRNGALVPAITAAINTNLQAGGKLANKSNTATLYHTLCAFGNVSHMASLTNTHSCMPHLWYKKGATIGCIHSLVNDAKKQAHYACAVFKGIYTNNHKPAQIKGLVVMQLAASTGGNINAVLQLWAAQLNIVGFTPKVFWQHVNKLSA